MLAPCPACPASPSPTEPGWARGGGWRMGMEGGGWRMEGGGWKGRPCLQNLPFPIPFHSLFPHQLLLWGALGILPLFFGFCSGSSEGSNRDTGAAHSHILSLRVVFGGKAPPCSILFFQERGIPSRRFVTALAWCCTHRGRWIRNSHQEEQGKRK